jgi:hypothetical protein
MSETTPTPDYTAMDTVELYQALQDDASKWAAAFCQHAEKLGHHGIDEGWMIGWFAAAIEHSSNVRRWWREDKARVIDDDATQGPFA